MFETAVRKGGCPSSKGGRPSSVNEVDSFPPRGSLDVRKEFKLTSIGGFAATFPEGESKRKEIRHSTCRDCLKTAIRQGFPKGKAGGLHQRRKLKNTNDTLQSVMNRRNLPEGESRGTASKAKTKNTNDMLQSVMKQAKPARRGKQELPLTTASRRSLPPRGSLDARKGFTFLPKKICKQNFMQARGKA